MKIPRLVLTLSVALAACGQTPHAASSAPRPTPAASATLAPTPTPDRPLLAVAEGGTLGLYALDGSQVARVRLEPGPRSGWPGVGGGMLTFVDGGVLKGLTPAGTVRTLGPLQGWSAGPVVVSPDGRRWMWSAQSFGASGSVSSRLVLSTLGVPDRVIAEQTAIGQVVGPLRWTAAGPTYQVSPTGVGGYILFGDGARGSSYRFDPDTGQVSPLLDGACYLADVAADGTIACFRPADNSLAVLRPDGHSPYAVPLPKPAFTQEGAVAFAFGSTATTLIVGGATSAGADGGQERYETDLLDIASRTLRPFGPAGLRPAPDPWLPDGSLVAYRPARAFGGDPGVYVVAPNGTARRVLAAGTPLGVVTARG